MTDSGAGTVEFPRPQRGCVLSFLGAARTVTGSRFLVDTPRARVLVDCGMFQGVKELRLRNWASLPVPAESIDSVVVTHAHLDHIGFLPALVRAGFRGPVHVTPGTAGLAQIVLPDSGRLQEEEAEYAGRKGYSRHEPPLPLYTEQDAFTALRRMSVLRFGEDREVADGVSVRFCQAGHILGSAGIEFVAEGRRIRFSGDLGRDQHPILRPPEPAGDADVVVVESTYGDRIHDDAASLASLRDAIVRTVDRGGTVVIPAFAVDRTEVVLYHLHRMVRSAEIPSVPVYVDSPMALAALGVYRRAMRERWPEIRDDLPADRDVFDPGRLTEVRDVEASKAIGHQTAPSIIVSASGMATGGRVLHHLARRLPDPRNAVILVGFQAPGTRGSRLVSGETSVKMLGRFVPVAAEIVNVPALSVHADAAELMRWLSSASRAPEAVFAVHGEERASTALTDRIHAELGWTAVVADHLERVRVGAGA